MAIPLDRLLHKRLSIYDPRNYRGVHLTSQLSKVVERILSIFLQPYVLPLDLFGSNQFAYTKERGARDAVAYLLMTWLWTFEAGGKVGLFCSDVQSAFDRVRADRLESKLKVSGVPSQLVDVLISWLAARRANFVVEGARSDDTQLQNMVYQGTVLGPPLWNLFFKDAKTAIVNSEFEEIVYADDLNAFKEFDSSTENEVILAPCCSCQSNLPA